MSHLTAFGLRGDVFQLEVANLNLHDNLATPWNEHHDISLTAPDE